MHEQAQKSLKVEVLTTELLNEKDEFDMTVWHYAALYGTLKDIPKRFFTKEVLNQRNYRGITTWHFAATGNSFKDIPKRFFTGDAFSQKNDCEKTVWHCAAYWNRLKDIPKHLINKNLLTMKNIKDEIKDENHGTLSKAVQFIEKNYSNVEQSISLPKNSLKLEHFVL